MTKNDYSQGAVYINGNFFLKHEAQISVFDQGFIFGDAIFDTLTVSNGYIFKINEHLDRLYKSAKAVDIHIPCDRKKLINIMIETVKKTQLKDAYLKCIVTRGVNEKPVMGKGDVSNSTIVVFAVPPVSIIDSKKINRILSTNGIILGNTDFLHFVMTSLTKREKLKFEFTKNLSAALELLVKYGNILEITREELSHIDIWSILKSNKNIKSKESISKFLSKKIKSNISKKIINDQLILPSIISSSKHFEVIDYFIAHPNFITKQSIIGKLVKLDRSKNERKK